MKTFPGIGYMPPSSQTGIGSSDTERALQVSGYFISIASAHMIANTVSAGELAGWYLLFTGRGLSASIAAYLVSFPNSLFHLLLTNLLLHEVPYCPTKTPGNANTRSKRGAVTTLTTANGIIKTSSQGVTTARYCTPPQHPLTHHKLDLKPTTVPIPPSSSLTSSCSRLLAPSWLPQNAISQGQQS